MPDGWRAWVGDEVRSNDERAVSLLEGEDDGGLVDAWRQTLVYTRPIIKLVAKPHLFPSIALAHLDKPMQDGESDAAELSRMINEAADLKGVKWITHGITCEINNVWFQSVEVLFESMGLETFTRTLLAPWTSGMLSIKLVGDDRDEVDRMMPILTRISFTPARGTR
ncbi:MAG: hypothetical protein AAGC44_10975 [Planctomycetota bacterium]